MKRVLIISVALTLNTVLFGQSDFRDGYILTNNHITLYGLINYRGDLANSTGCFFKLRDSEKVTGYEPGEIYGYRFTGNKFYISHDVTVNGINQKRFLEFLVHGIVDLYCLREVSQTRYFVQKPGEDLVELRQTETEFYLKDKKYQVANKEYVDTLKSMFSDAPDLYSRIDNLYMSRKSLINLTEDYHNEVCKDEACIIYEKKLPKFKIHLGVTGGINKVTLSNETFYISGLDLFNGHTFYCNFEKSENYLAGIYVNIPFLYSSDRFSFQYETMLNKNGFASYCVSNRTNDTVNFSIDYNTIGNNFFVRYNILKWKFRPTVQLGFIVDYHFNLLYKGIEEYRPFFRCASIGLMGGLGFALKLKENRELFFEVIASHSKGVLYYFNADQINFKLGIPVF